MRRFIAQCVQTVEQLEVLCLVSGGAGKSWDAAGVFSHIQSTVGSVARCLDRFVVLKLLKLEEGRYRFSPADPAHVSIVAELIKAYRERRVTIIQTIYNRPVESIENFAEAFRIKRKE